MSKNILCVYATRQVDSNLFMASTVFRGLYEAGYETDIVFAGTGDVINDFKRNYEHWFRIVVYLNIPTSGLKKLCDRHPVSKLGYSFYRHFIADGFTHLPFDSVKTQLGTNYYDCILSFIPPVMSGRLGYDVRKALKQNARLIQFWTDPLSLGRCDSVADIPRSRFIHKWNERRLLKAADKVVFWFPLLCQMEQQLHPLYAEKMTWSDVSYVPHDNSSRTNNVRQHVTIGLFGAYPANVRNITPLLEAIKRLQNIKFVIRGDGDLPNDVSNISNLDIRQGRLPIDEIEALENDCDILLSLSSKNGIAPGGKTFYYASYNKPIIHIADGVNGESYNGYLKDLGERYVCCMNNVDEIQSTITKVVSELPNFTLKIPQRMDAAVIARKIIEE